MTDRIKLTKDDFDPVSDYLIYLSGNDDTIKQILDDQEKAEYYNNRVSFLDQYQKENKELKEQLQDTRNEVISILKINVDNKQKHESKLKMMEISFEQINNSRNDMIKQLSNVELQVGNLIHRIENLDKQFEDKQIEILEQSGIIRELKQKLEKIEKFIDSDKFDDLCTEFGEFDFTKPLENLKAKLKKILEEKK